MSAPFVVTRVAGWGYTPIASLEARDIGQAVELAFALYGQWDAIEGRINDTGISVWYAHLVPDAWLAQVKAAEREADREDVVDCVKLHWRRFFDKTEKHNH